MDPDERKVDIEHGNPCGCWIDEGAIYVRWPCKRFGDHVTKRRLGQLVQALRRRDTDRLKESMQILFMTPDLSRTVGQLTAAATRHSKRDLFAAAVTFTTQLAIDAASSDPEEARALERKLIAKLAPWLDEDGELTQRLWTHDILCVIGLLDRAAEGYGRSAVSVEVRLRDLTTAAVAFTTQVAIEETIDETESDAAKLRALEHALITRLEGPFELAPFPISVEAPFGKTWGQLKDKP